MNSLQPKNLAVFDFDHTIIECNSDLEIKALLPEDIAYPECIEQLRKQKNGWMEFMRQVFRFLHVNGINHRHYNQRLKSMPLVPGMKKLLCKLGNDPDFEIIIVSDANSYFIKCVVLENGLDGVVKEIVTNPATFEDGCLVIREYEMQEKCHLCTRNICKGSVLEERIQNRENSNDPYEKVIYIGDGSNDVCPALKLRQEDLAFARQGYSMLKRLQKLPDGTVRAKIIPWDDGYDIMNVLFPSQC